MSWRENQQKREKDVRIRLKSQGIDLLRMIVDETSKLLPPGTNIEFNQDQVMSRWNRPDDGYPIMTINGYPIELRIEQHATSGDWRPHFQDRLTVKVEWIWVNSKVAHKSKTFGYSAKRVGTHGFEPEKIAAHIVWWMGEKKRLEAIELDKAKLKERERKLRGEWEGVASRIESTFHLPESATCEATPKGVRISVVVNESQAVAALQAAGFKKKP